LEIQADANVAQIKKAYYKCAQKYHPDKNRNDPNAADKFRLISEAYEVLMDAQKKAIYDKFGKEGLNNPNVINTAAPFRPAQNRGPDILQPLFVTLQELYCGTTKKVTIYRNIICKSCQGSGLNKNAQPRKCRGCDGRGVRVRAPVQYYPQVAQVTEPCETCSGTGQFYPDTDKCGLCRGKKLTVEPKTLTVDVLKGMDFGEQISLFGESDEAPNSTTGNVIFTLQSKEPLPKYTDDELNSANEKFYRHGVHLIVKKKISVVDALLCNTFSITHLDGRKITGKCIEVINGKDFYKLEGEGMPVSGGQNGNLYILFELLFPQKLTQKQQQAIRTVFNSPETTNWDGDDTDPQGDPQDFTTATP
jgi:DnaJ family protein A protein 2